MGCARVPLLVHGARTVGKETGTYADTLFNLAMVYESQGKLPDAVTNLEEYVGIRTKVGIPLDDGDEELLEKLRSRLSKQ